MALAIFILAIGSLVCIAIITTLLIMLFKKEDSREEDNKIMIMRLHALEKIEREKERKNRLKYPKSSRVKTVCFRQPNLN